MEHVDVLIVGAGLSGIGAAVHLRTDCPRKSWAIVEARGALGGTWDLFRYPGIRSDSDMFTLGYRFKPWRGEKSIADGASILDYIRETAREYGITDKIRFHRKLVRAAWSTDEQRWTLDLQNTETGDVEQMTATFLYSNTGVYNADEGYTPHFEGRERFEGEVVHPQHWPDDLAVEGRRVVVIGSGATAVTLVPALAAQGAHVTMVQRSPTYIVSLPAEDPIANRLRRRLPAQLAYPIVRWKNVVTTQGFYELSRRRPERVKAMIRTLNQRRLPKGFDIDTHFAPQYNPWDQRLCVVPNGDLFRAIRKGRAEVVTDRITSFTERGLELESGREIDADIIVTATGFNVLLLGGATFSVDGDELDWSEQVGYKGLMFCGVPNLAVTLGYTNASWTLKADLTAQYVCRLLNHMDRHGYGSVTPVLPDDSVEVGPFIDLTSGYVRRALHLMPKQGSKNPWRLWQIYPIDLVALRHGSVTDKVEFAPRVRQPVTAR